MLCCLSVPALRPLLSIGVPGALPFIGDVMELRCEDKRASPPVLYRFYHENVTLGSVSAPLGGRASFRLALTVGHSGNYSCEADNGWGTKRSEKVALSVTGRTIQGTVPGCSSHCAGLAGSLPFAVLPASGNRSPTGGPSSPPALLFSLENSIAVRGLSCLLLFI